MLYKIRKMSEGISIKIKCESDESLDRLELARFSNANIKGFISDTEIKGKCIVAETSWGMTLSEYLENSLNFEAIILLLRQCIDIVENIIKNNFLLMYVELNFEHVWVSNYGALQFLYLPTEEERASRRVMSFINEILGCINPSDDMTEVVFRDIKENIVNMPFYNSCALREIIDSAGKDYFKVLEAKNNENEKQNKEAQIGTSSNISVVMPKLYNINTGELMTYNPGDVIVISDMDSLDQDITSHLRRNFKTH